MNNTTLTIKIDKKTKDESQKLAEKLGFTLSAVIKAQLRQFVRTKQVDVTLSEERPTKLFDKLLKQADEDIKAGRLISFKDPRDVFAYLDKKIAYAKKNNLQNSR